MARLACIFRETAKKVVCHFSPYYNLVGGLTSDIKCAYTRKYIYDISLAYKHSDYTFICTCLE